MTSESEAKPPELLPLAARFKSASITLTVASAAYDIWWFYISKDTRDLQAMNEFPSFFLYDQESHFRTVIVSLYTLYDSFDRTPTLTIKSLIHEIPEVAGKPIWRKYKSVMAIAKKISIIRHEYLAHRNPVKTVDTIFKEAKLEPNNIKALIQDTLEILRMVATEIGEPEPTLSPFITDDTAGLLNRIKIKT